jgi:hypothetical protein
MLYDEVMSDLAARIKEFDARLNELDPQEKWLRAELIELVERIGRLHERPTKDDKGPTTRCKSCGAPMSEPAAAASIFRLSFLPVHGKKIDRHKATQLAEQVGPLWYAEHVYQLEGGSPLSSLMEVKD